MELSRTNWNELVHVWHVLNHKNVINKNYYCDQVVYTVVL